MLQVVTLTRRPAEEAKSGVGVGPEFRRAEGLGDEGRGEADEEAAAVGIEIGVYGVGVTEEGKDADEPGGEISGGVVLVARAAGGGREIGEVEEWIYPFGRQEGRRVTAAQAAAAEEGAQAMSGFSCRSKSPAMAAVLMMDRTTGRKERREDGAGIAGGGGDG